MSFLSPSHISSKSRHALKVAVCTRTSPQSHSFHTTSSQSVGYLNKRVRWTIDLRDKPYANLTPSNRLSGRATQLKLKEYVKPDKFAIVHVSGRQYRVCVGDRIVCDRLFVDIGEKILLNKVLMVGGPDYTLIGRPIVEPTIHVEAVVEEQTRTQGVIVFKRKKRKRYQRWNTSRNLVTVLRIERIEFENEDVKNKLLGEQQPAQQKPVQAKKSKKVAESL